jgi:hypothetical protein
MVPHGGLSRGVLYLLFFVFVATAKSSSFEFSGLLRVGLLFVEVRGAKSHRQKILDLRYLTAGDFRFRRQC